MEVRCIREALWRPGSSPLQSFLAPCLLTACRPRSPTAFSYYKDLQSHRYLSTSVSFRADPPSSTTSPEKPKIAKDAQANLKEIFDRTRDERAPPLNPPTILERNHLIPKINAKFDELFPPKNSPQPPPSATVGEVDKAYKSFLDKNRAGLKPGSLAASMMMPGNKGDFTSGLGLDTSLLGDHSGNPRRRSKRTIRSRPTVGRTIEVEEKMGVDLGRALSRLSTLISTNNVRKDLYAQKYHERPGLKRKRLKHDRWKRYFKAGFEAMVQRALQMRRQGW